ncbi:MAG: hypothetical protein AB9882_14345 [Ignavibacteriaceae bacterium]
MKLIQKSIEPNKLRAHRCVPGTNYDSFQKIIGLGEITPATGLRKSLLDDQGCICAYCMRRIPHSHTAKGITTDNMKIEHYIPQTDKISIGHKLDITYSNMLACCMGNQGKDKKFETCDTRKGNNILTISPLNEAHIRTLNYAPDGSIHSKNKLFEEEISKVLNLNEDNLRKQREAIYKSIEKIVKKEFRRPYMTKIEKNKFLDQLINMWSSKKYGKFDSFCMVAITYLENRKK